MWKTSVAPKGRPKWEKGKAKVRERILELTEGRGKRRESTNGGTYGWGREG